MNTLADPPPPEGSAMDELLVRVHHQLIAKVRTTRRTKRDQRLRLIASGAVLVMAGGGAAVAAAGGLGGASSSAEQSERLDLPHGVLPDGRTYGAPPVPGANELSDEDMPDLLPATGDRGREGLIDSGVLAAWEPTGPCESKKIPVYALDGKTKIDTLTIGHATELVPGLDLVERSGEPCSELPASP